MGQKFKVGSKVKIKYGHAIWTQKKGYEEMTQKLNQGWAPVTPLKSFYGETECFNIKIKNKLC